MLKIEHAAMNCIDPGLDLNEIIGVYRMEKLNVRFDQWYADNTVFVLQSPQTCSSCPQQGVHRGVEPPEEVGVEDDSGRVAVTEFDPDRVSIAEHGLASFFCLI